MDKKDLKKIVDDDDLGLLKIKPKSSTADTADERLIISFKEINDFFKRSGKEPQANSKDILEFQLHSRLEALRRDKEKVEKLLPFDEHDLLKNIKPIESINDIFSDDDLGLLSDSKNSIFEIKHIPKEKNVADYIARRKPCKDFSNFEPIFIQCHKDLLNRNRMLLPFAKEKQMTKGVFFILKGLLIYIADVLEDDKNKRSPRLRVIFENGTEADLLGHSLGSQLYRDGRRVSEHNEKLLDGFGNIDSTDEHTGFIYVLRSLSDRDQIKNISDLYKVGFSSMPVEDRIKDAENDPTFLLGPVQIVTTFRCYNINPQKMELLLHKFFGAACLNIDIVDPNGNRSTPREWFVAPLNIIEQAVHYILTEEIVNFKYDPDSKQIIGREP